MAPPSGSPRWLVAGAAASVVVGVVAALLLVRRSEPAVSAPAPSAGEVVAEVEVQQATAVPEAFASPEAEAAPVVSAGALSGLRSMLGKARLFAQLASFGDRLELRSASCEDSQLAALLAEAREGLWQAGFRRVRCLAPHGQVVFERDL